MLKKNKNKWSNKYDKCKLCWTNEIRHKARWTCINCYEKVRAKIRRRDPIELEKIKKNQSLWFQRVMQNKDYREKVRLRSNENYHKNKFILNIKRQVKKRKEKWLPCLKMYYNDNEIEFPFESLEKPKHIKEKEFKIWQKNNEIFEKMINLINNKNKNESKKDNL